MGINRCDWYKSKEGLAYIVQQSIGWGGIVAVADVFFVVVDIHTVECVGKV